VVVVAKAIKYVIELSAIEARTFLDSLGKPNPIRDKMVADARKLNWTASP